MRFTVRLLGAELFTFEFERAAAAGTVVKERAVLEAGSGGLFDADGLDFPRADEVKLGFGRS
jgi:hypothetical protein